MTTNRTYKSGQSRDQVSFLPPCLEDYVGRDNPVRAVDVYVDSLDLNELGFRDVGSDGGAGQPPYDPADLLRLYLYGYLHQVRSSRRLERETRRKNWPPCASGGRWRRPIWQSLRRAAMARSHAPTRTPGCWPSTGKSSLATTCRSRLTTSTS